MKVKGWTRYTMKILAKIKQELGIFLSDKVDIGAENIIRDRQTHYGMTEGFIFQEGSHSKCMWTQWQSFRIRETKPNGTEGRVRQSHIHSGRPEHPFLDSWCAHTESPAPSTRVSLAPAELSAPPTAAAHTERKSRCAAPWAGQRTSTSHKELKLRRGCLFTDHEVIKPEVSDRKI